MVLQKANVPWFAEKGNPSKQQLMCLWSIGSFQLFQLVTSVVSIWVITPLVEKVLNYMNTKEHSFWNMADCPKGSVNQMKWKVLVGQTGRCGAVFASLLIWHSARDEDTLTTTVNPSLDHCS